jgi:hypothetical protein
MLRLVLPAPFRAARPLAVAGLAAVLALSACAHASPAAAPKPAPALPVTAINAANPVTSPAAGASVAAATTDVSWNKHVVCKATITTLRALLGSQRSSLGGATFAGGGFKPGIPDKRSTNPPCAVSGVPTLVELHRVQFSKCSKINNDGDWTCPLIDPSQVGKLPADMYSIHVELDGNFRAKGWAPAIPPGGKLVDVQGFVFWDPGHTTAAWHHHSGWEIHSFTAWRLSA